MSIFNMDNLPEEPEEQQSRPLIMLVDDEIENINVLRGLLEEHFSIITALNGAEALEKLDEMSSPEEIQLIITDQRMPKLTGVEFLEKIVDRMPDTIRIILTGYSDTQVIIDAINKAKLYKFITKPFDPVELSLTVRRGVEAYQMRKALIDYANNLERLVVERTEELNEKNNELTQALASLEELSLSDQLTQVYNRHFLDKFMPQELAKLKRHYEVDSNEGFGLILIDIDFFKKVNDKYGHDSGDKVLKQFSQILKDTCRESDWIIRWGGEEFVIVVREQAVNAIEQLAERIRQNVQATVFELECGQRINCTCSMGVVCFPFIRSQFDALTWEQTLNFADQALYVAKNSGRNTWIKLIENPEKSVNSDEYLDRFYEKVMTNLVDLIEQKIVLYRTPLSEKKLKL